jgi:demethylspheroidene O-methyltransferase
MADSQAPGGRDTLRLVDLSGVRHLMDVGGGTGAFLRAVHAVIPRCADAVRPARRAGRRAALPWGRAGRSAAPGSFRDDPLPQGPMRSA